MKPIDRAKNHFLNRKAREVLVQEWQDEQGRPLAVWFNPLTVKDREAMLHMEKRYGQGLELVVHVLIAYAKDGQGQPLFSLEDKHDLMNKVDPNVLGYIAGELLKELEPEEIKKKSSPI
jgi:hypothetical protein